MKGPLPKFPYKANMKKKIGMVRLCNGYHLAHATVALHADLALLIHYALFSL